MADEDFLSRERDILGEDFGSAPVGESHFDPDAAASAFPDIDGLGDDARFPDISGSTPAAPADVPAISPGLDNGVATPPSAAPAAADDVAAFESSFPALEEPISPPVQQQPPTFPQQSSFTSTTPAAPHQPPLFCARLPTDPEPEPVRAWRERRAAEIAERDAESEKKKEETVLKAEKAIDDFYTEYNERKAANIAKNKEEEAEFQAKRTDALASGTTWERICDLVELENSQSKTMGRKDVPRFKEVLLSLKRQGERAPAAAGY